MGDRDLMLLFESLGNNCEFAFAQRAFDAEPQIPGLFRWAGTQPDVLIRILENKFDRIANSDDLSLELVANGEWFLRHRLYNLVWHTFAREGETTVEKLHAREVRRLEIMSERTIEHMIAADLTWVMRCHYPLPVDTVLTVLGLLRQFGPNTLLWVTEDPDKAGTVERATDDGLLRGYIANFADSGRVNTTTDPAAWLTICRAAFHCSRT